MQIPTKMIGAITSKIINGKRVKLYPTDAGVLTGEQIFAVTHLREWRILERYYKYGRYSLEIFAPIEPSKVIRKHSQDYGSSIDLSHIEQGKYAHLGTKERANNNLLNMAIGTWERDNLN